MVIKIKAQTFGFNITPSKTLCLNNTNYTLGVSVINSPSAATSFSWGFGHNACQLSSNFILNTPNGSMATLSIPEMCCGNGTILCQAYDANNNLLAVHSETCLLYCFPNVTITATTNSATNSILCNGTHVTLSASGVQSFTWNGPGISGVNTSSITVSPTISSCYSVAVSNTLGCNSNAVSCFTIVNCTSLNNMYKKSDFYFYPNPANRFLNVKISENNNYDFQSLLIYNSFGVLLRKEDMISEKQTVNIKIDDLIDGVYFIQFKSISNKIISCPFIIQH